MEVRSKWEEFWNALLLGSCRWGLAAAGPEPEGTAEGSGPACSVPGALWSWPSLPLPAAQCSVPSWGAALTEPVGFGLQDLFTHLEDKDREK